ncbi:MAG: SRPBCC domain-containing protein [Deltaproteobacteria bacterium]|nr:MAG: SRPBCC domain-containing protein [Deltaproteobacteria bacterium]
MPRRTCGVDIDAPAELVWDVMVDFARYGEWNPFLPQVDEDGAGVGGRLVLHVVFPSGRKTLAKERITVFQPPADAEGRLVYEYQGRGRIGRMIVAERSQTVVRLGEARCRYDTLEVFGGWLGWAVPLGDIQAGLEQQAEHLKRHCEALHRAI